MANLRVGGRSMNDEKIHIIMNKRILVSDITMKLADEGLGNPLSFRQKIELSKLLDKLGVSVIETGKIQKGKQDCLLIKSLATTVKDGILAVPIDIFNPESVELTWNALQQANHPRLQVAVPVSTVQMEYLCHKKPAGILEMVADYVSRCASYCKDVEFIAEDFGRSEEEFLLEVVKTAVENGATTLTFYDTAGALFDYEFHEIISKIRSKLPDSVNLGVRCSNELYMADTCGIAAVRAGANEIKTTPYGNETTSLKRFVRILSAKSSECHASCDVKEIELTRIISQIKMLCRNDRSNSFANLDGVDAAKSELQLTVHDDMNSIMKVAAELGYELSEDDGKSVFEAFQRLASKNGIVEAKELDAIIASVVYQVPPTYKLDSYLINTGNVITTTCHMVLRRNEEVLEGVCLGDGPVDAAFLAIEQLVGNKYELDDFQIQSVTEGSKAMGEAIVRLRFEGKIYSGRGISRDIVGASILAYLSAVNKIVYEETEA